MTERWQTRLEDDTLDHETRAHIGEQLDRAGDPRPGVGLRSDGLPDITWCPVDVPAGRRTFANERGVEYGEFALQPFAIARYPVTNHQFHAFQESPDGFRNPEWWHGLAERYHQQEVIAQRAPFDNHPRDSVSWIQAVAFTRWLTAQTTGETVAGQFVIGENAELRLPLEWEWHWAAQGDDNRSYPWGLWDSRFANTRECRLSRTTAVGMYPHGASWSGALDMSGNVWEWCLNEYKTPARVSYDSDLSRVLRGGAFMDVPEWAVCASRFNDLPNRRLDYFGFRIVCAARP